MKVMTLQQKICIFGKNRLLLQIFVKDKLLDLDFGNFDTKNISKIPIIGCIDISYELISFGIMSYYNFSVQMDHPVRGFYEPI